MVQGVLGKPVTSGMPLELDSLEVMAICVGAEQQLGLELSFGEVNQAKTYGDLEALLEMKAP